MRTNRRNYAVVDHIVQVHDTGYHDVHDRSVQYETTIEAITRLDAPEHKAWRVWGRQLRDDRPKGRPSTPLHVATREEAHTLAQSLFRRHLRYVERNVATYDLRAASAEEDLAQLCERI